MTETERKTDTPHDAHHDAHGADRDPAGATEADPRPAESAEAAEPVEIEQARRIAELEALVAELKERSLRALAEVDNVRKRTQKEVDDTRRFAISGFAKELLVVSDNLRRALDAAPKDPDTALKNFLIGVEATERQLASAFEKAGIRKMEPLGKPADPNLHQIMMEVDGGDAPPMTVVQVLQDGYTIHDRLLREAYVGVARRNAGAADAPKVDEQA
jgi:molecular chaperone GrpE